MTSNITIYIDETLAEIKLTKTADIGGESVETIPYNDLRINQPIWGEHRRVDRYHRNSKKPLTDYIQSQYVPSDEGEFT